ncbi:MAG: FCSD flavin-binding domain-containing protein [Pseudomonadota bacterium]|nr:FCSD flavin-binding domain-containing protein [Pseudomonadota bacterium]
MSSVSRRNFIRLVAGAGATSALALAGCKTPTEAGKAGGNVIVIGGGFGGATCARYLKKFDPSVNVTLIETNKVYHTCPGSNWVLGGMQGMDRIAHGFSKIEAEGVDVVHDWVTSIDPDARKVNLKGGGSMTYDRLVVSPGIDFRFDTIEGYDAQASGSVPHAWKAGPQTELLRRQLEAMPDGGTFVLASPPNPFRCPPGPYERVSLIAHYFKTEKPKSKIIILDSKPKFSKQGLFTAGWSTFYGFGTDDSMIDWIPAPDGTVTRVDVKKKIAYAGGDSGFEQEIEADVLNVIPAQKAGAIAHAAGLADDSGWCPVDQMSFESKIHKNIHVIGDSSIAAPLPKSGYAANSEAKVAAAAIVNLLQGKAPDEPTYVNTCYSLITPDYGISVAMVYDSVDGKVSKVKGSGGLTPKDGDNSLAAIYTRNWYDNVTNDIWGTGSI